jgi:hypothetical protein
MEFPARLLATMILRRDGGPESAIDSIIEANEDCCCHIVVERIYAASRFAETSRLGGDQSPVAERLFSPIERGTHTRDWRS